MTRARTWAIVACVATVAVTVGTRFWLGTDDWAGLGQWVGGLGSFAAVVAALSIADGERRREASQRRERATIHPYYIVGSMRGALVLEGPARGMTDWKLLVTNLGTEPVLDVEIIALYAPDDPTPMKITTNESPRRVLVPGAPWSVGWESATQQDDYLLRGAMDTFRYLWVEIRFTDLAGVCWRRIGNQAPTPESKVAE